MEVKQEKPVKDDKTLEIDLGGVDKDVTIFTGNEMIADLDKQSTEGNNILKEQSSAPSHTVKTFRDQFSMYNGNLYSNINNSWTKLSVSELVGGVIGTNLITNDTYINRDEPSTNYGTEDPIIVLNNDSGSGEHQSLLFANLERLNGTSITSATLYLYVSSGALWVTRDINAKRVLSRWDDLAVTWGSAPSVTSADQGSVSIADSLSGEWKTMDITNIVQGWLDRSYDNFGLAITTAVSANFASVDITSSEATSNKPYIEIV